MTDTMNKEALAAHLNRRQYGEETDGLNIADVKAAGLVIVHGYSDENMELRGAINEEIGCYNGGKVLIDAQGIIPEWDLASESEKSAEDYFRRKPHGRTIEAVWCAKDGDGFAWTYKTDIPHVTFEIYEGVEKFCRGIVFHLDDLKR